MISVLLVQYRIIFVLETFFFCDFPLIMEVDQSSLPGPPNPMIFRISMIRLPRSLMWVYLLTHVSKGFSENLHATWTTVRI